MKARVWNDHTNDYTEKYKGDMVLIPAGKFIEMDSAEATAFLGTFTPIQRDGQKRDLFPKMLRIEKMEKDAPLAPTFVCQKDGTMHASQAELDNHIANNYTDSIIDEKGRDALKKRKGA